MRRLALLPLLALACTSDGEPGDTEVEDTDDTAVEETDEPTAPTCVLPNAFESITITSPAEAEAFCAEFSGVQGPNTLRVIADDAGTLPALDCLCEAETLMIEATGLSEVVLPNLERAPFFSVRTDTPTLERLSLPSLTDSDSLSVTGSAKDGPPVRVELDAARRLGRLTFHIPVDGFPRFTGDVELDALYATIRPSDHPVPWTRVSVRELHLTEADAAVFERALPCLDVTESLRLFDASGAVTWKHCSHAIPSVSIYATHMSDLVFEPPIEVYRDLTVQHDDSLRYVTGLELGEELEGFTWVGPRLALRDPIETKQIHVALFKGPADLTDLDSVHTMGRLTLLGTAAYAQTGLDGLETVDAARISGPYDGILGLRHLREAGQLTLDDLSRIRALDLPTLRRVDTLSISNSPALTDLKGLHSLEHVGRLCVSGNATLPSAEVDALVGAIEDLGDVCP